MKKDPLVLRIIELIIQALIAVAAWVSIFK